jgi:hypothetical protein
VPAIGWGVVGLVVCVAAARLGLGSWRHPQPGLFPFLIGGGMVLLAGVLAASAVRAAGAAPAGRPTGDVRRVAVVLVALAFYALALERVGFAPCTLVFFVLLFRGLGRQSWVVSAVSAAVATGAAYLVFEVWLAVNLPRGPLGY